MPTPTYTPLATVTLASATATVTFSSIPATYRDLIFIFNGVGSASGYGFFRFNGDTGNNYNYVFMYGDVTPVSSGASNTIGFFGNIEPSLLNPTVSNIMDYSATDKHKTYLSRNDRVPGIVIATAGRWANTAAITSMSVNKNGGNFQSGSTFSLYGVIS
jgi:hypothetical protein